MHLQAFVFSVNFVLNGAIVERLETYKYLGIAFKNMLACTSFDGSF